MKISDTTFAVARDSTEQERGRLTRILGPENRPAVIVVQHIRREGFLQHVASFRVQRLVELLPCLFLRGLPVLRFLGLVRPHGVHGGLGRAAGAP